MIIVKQLVACQASDKCSYLVGYLNSNEVDKIGLSFQQLNSYSVDACTNAAIFVMLLSSAVGLT